MSLYSCHLVTRKALTLLAPDASDLPTDWFSWSYQNPSQESTLAVARIEFIETSSSKSVEVWYRRVVAAGLLPTIVRTIEDEKKFDFEDDAIDPRWGGVTPLFEGILIPDEDEPTRGWRKRLQQPDDLALVSWSECRRGGGMDETDEFQLVPEFARCYGEELKRWIEISSNAELITKQWQDPRGWPEDCPSLEPADFAWDRSRWSAERTQLWVPMLRLPFCEIGFTNSPEPTLMTCGLLPNQPTNLWSFDSEQRIQTLLREKFYEQRSQTDTVAADSQTDKVTFGERLFQTVINFFGGTALAPAAVMGSVTEAVKITRYPAQTIETQFGSIQVTATQRGPNADCQVQLVSHSSTLSDANLEVRLNDSEWNALMYGGAADIWLESTDLLSRPITVTVQNKI